MKKKVFKIPTAYTVLFLITIAVAIFTWIIPAGSYQIDPETGTLSLGHMNKFQGNHKDFGISLWHRLLEWSVMPIQEALLTFPYLFYLLVAYSASSIKQAPLMQVWPQLLRVEKAKKNRSFQF